MHFHCINSALCHIFANKKSMFLQGKHGFSVYYQSLFRFGQSRCGLLWRLTEQERQHTETERHGDEAGNEAESGYAIDDPPRQKANRKLRKIAGRFPERAAPDKHADEKAQEHRRSNDRRGIDEQQHEGEPQSYARYHQQHRRDGQPGQHRKADAEGSGVIAESRAVILGVELSHIGVSHSRTNATAAAPR